MALREILVLLVGAWLIFAVAYMTRPVDPSINDKYLKAAPELSGLEVKVVDDVVTLPLDLSPLEIPKSELRLAAQEISSDEWQYIQLRPYPPRLQNPNPRPHNARVVDKQTKRAWRSVAKKKVRRVRKSNKRVRRKRKLARVNRTTRKRKKRARRVRAKRRPARQKPEKYTAALAKAVNLSGSR